MVRLNLGCGEQILQGWDNYDINPCTDAVKYIDLNKIPYPFPDNYADEILFSHVLEHLTTHPLDVMKELHRILKPGGRLIVKLPVNSNIVEHVHARFNIYYFNPILQNPVGQFVITSIKKNALFKLIKVRKKRNFQLVLFERRLGGGIPNNIKGIRKDWLTFIRHLPHRVWDMLFNGEIVWVMEAIK